MLPIVTVPKISGPQERQKERRGKERRVEAKPTVAVLPKPSGQCPVRKGGDTAASFLFFKDLHK